MLCDMKELIFGHKNPNFSSAGVNYRLNARCYDNQEDFFDKLDDLRDLLDMNYQAFFIY